jgi:ABC-type nitrate/sulfonate/bicarbonate transport system substrate-binding protein
VRPAKAACTAPSTVNVGFSGSPGATNWQEITFFKYDLSIDATCHTTVNLEYFASTSAEAAALLGGSVQYVSGGIAASLNTIAQGDNAIAVIAGQSEGGGSIYVASTKYKSFGIGEGALGKFAKAGLLWGVPTAIGPSSIFYAALSHQWGIPVSDIKMVVQGNNGVAGLLNNQVQLEASAPSNLEPELASGQYYTVWYSSGEQAIALLKGQIVLGSALMATRTTLADYPVLTQTIVTDAIKALMWMRKNANNPATIYSVFSPAAKTGYPYSAWGPVWDIARASNLVVTGYYNRTEYQQLANRYYNVGLLTTDPQILAADAPTKYVTNAYKSLGLTPPTNDVDPSQEFWASDKYTGLTAAG